MWFAPSAPPSWFRRSRVNLAAVRHPCDSAGSPCRLQSVCRPGRRAVTGPALLALQRGLVAERELRVLGHLVRGPRRGEDHRRRDGLDALDLADELDDLLGDLRADRAG